MEEGSLTSRALVLHYMDRIARIDRDGVRLQAVLEWNPDAVSQAERLDRERAEGRVRGPLHGIPVLLKDNINTGDNMHTSAGSLALADSFALADAHLVKLLREAGAVLLGKANMTEFANYMTTGMPSGYSSRGGQVRNPYGPGRFQPGGSSAGSAVAVAANLCAVSVGTETSGSILHPAYHTSIVGIKPTVGLISRSGIVPITYTQDTAGPMARTVRDAALLLGAMAGPDPADEATLVAGPGQLPGDYASYCEADGLRGARIGINRGYEEDFKEEEKALLDRAIQAMREAGAEIVESVNLPHIGKSSVLLHEFKSALNRYLSSLGPDAPVRTLADLIRFHNEHPKETLKYGQTLLLRAELETSGTLTEPAYLLDRMRTWQESREDGIDRVLQEHRLDALLCPGVTNIPAAAGYPAIMVPAGFRQDGHPFGVSFVGTAYSEPALIRIAYAFEQAYPMRRAPEFPEGTLGTKERTE